MEDFIVVRLKNIRHIRNMNKKLIFSLVIAFAGILLGGCCPDDITFETDNVVASFDDPRDCPPAITQNTCTDDQNVDPIYKQHAEKCKRHCSPCKGTITSRVKGVTAECRAGEDVTELVCKTTKSECECDD